MRPPDDNSDVDADTLTGEVGSEGGSPGDVEVVRRREPSAGTEATETWRPWRDDTDTIARDETGAGRRSP
jgi:hypothetical protein